MMVHHRQDKHLEREEVRHMMMKMENQEMKIIVTNEIDH